jgi:flagellar hook-associated protein 2
MGEFNLPGISSSNNIDVKGIIDKLVKVESKKLERYESGKDQLDKEKSSWVTLNTKLGNLQKTSEELYGFRSPFEEKIAISSDDSILRAKASRIAQPSTSVVKVQQIAKNERIISDPVESTRVLNDVLLRMNVGEKELGVRFDGGPIDRLAEEINRQAGDHVSAKVTKDTDQTSVLILEVKQTGEKNRIGLKDEDTADFFEKIGLFEKREGFQVDTTLSPQRVFPLEGSSRYTVRENELILEPENSVELLFEHGIKSRSDIELSVKVRAVDLRVEPEERPQQAWPELNSIGSVTVRDVEIVGGKPVEKITVPEKVEEKPEVITNTVIGIGSEKGPKKNMELDALNSTYREYRFRLTDFVPEGSAVDRIYFINENTGRRVEFSDVVIKDLSDRGGVSPKHPVQEGQDSVVFIDGVRVQRDTNTIDDALKGVELELRGARDEEISLTVDRDYELITGRIVDMVGRYNELLEFINEQTKVVSSGRLTEKAEAGILSGDITVMGLKSRLQKIMMNPYPTGSGRELSLLAQIGISMGSLGSNWEDIKGGYLRVDEDAFVEAFRKYPESIKQLFGNDTNNDVVVDNGVAYVLDTTLKAYTNPRGGIVSNRIAVAESGITAQQNRIDDYRDYLEDYRKKLESDFTLMQQALYELEQNQKSIENFSNQYGK